MDAQRMIQLRAQKDTFFKSNPNSPLTDAQKALFTGLSYYVPQPNWDQVVTVSPFEKKDNIQMQHTKGDARWFMRYGNFTIEAAGQQASLTLYRSADYFFLPFVDANAGTETYPAGRYLEPVQMDEFTFHVDFNQAYNPYCAYNDKWNCPITPAENRIAVAITAGEKLPTGDWIDEAHQDEDNG